MINKHMLRLLNVTNQGTTKDNHSLIQLYSNRLTKNFFFNLRIWSSEDEKQQEFSHISGSRCTLTQTLWVTA